MASEKQVLVQQRSSLLRDLAGCRAQLNRISAGLQKHGVESYDDLKWLRSSINLLTSVDEKARKCFKMRPIQTYDEQAAMLDKRAAAFQRKLAKKYPQMQEYNL